jgi:predicted nucleotidyltransferase
LLRERLREILRGTSAEDLEGPLEELIGELVGKLDPVAVVVAGSLAKGRFVRGLSDVDILVVVDRPVRNEERFSLAPLGGADAEITVVSLDELERAVRAGNQFYLDALRSGKVVYARGAASGLNALQRLACELGERSSRREPVAEPGGAPGER